MIFKRLTIQGFRSFDKEQELEFDLPAGFYLLSGENRLEPDLGANGSGKSTVWDALCWALFGKTARGIRGTAVRNWDPTANLTKVVVEFEHNGGQYVVTRTHDPNTLTLDRPTPGSAGPRTVAQEELEAILGFGYTAFLHTALMGQFNAFFFDLSATEKLKLFSELLQLDLWAEASKGAKERWAEVDAERQEAEKEESSLASRLATLKEELAKAKEDARAFDERREQEAGELQKEVQRLTTLHQGAKARRDACRVTLEEAEVRRELVQKQMLEKDDERSALKEEWGRHVALVRDLTKARERLEQSAQQLRSGTCPECGQPVDGRKALAETLTLLHRNQEEGKAASTLEQATKGKVDAANQRLKQLAAADEEAEAHIQDAVQDLQEAGKEMRAHKEALGAAQARYDLLTGQGNPHQQRVQDLRSQEQEASKGWERAGEAARRAYRLAEHLAFWSRKFKEVRLWLVKQSLLELEIEVSNVLSQLGLEGWGVEFDIERENRLGQVSRGFTCLIRPPGGAEAVPWEAWSGGETQRLRIAGAVGLARLISHRLGLTFNLEVWDEPTAHLSEEGVHDLLDFFEGRCREERKQIWMVDHRTLNAGSFDGEVRVVKGGKGSRIKRLQGGKTDRDAVVTNS